jgi:hypothetical protein
MHDDTDELRRTGDGIELEGEIVRRLIWGDPLRSVYVRKWVGFVLFALVAIAIAFRLPAAGALERYVVAPLLLVAVVLAIASLFVVRGARSIRRREALTYLGDRLVEEGVIGYEHLDAVRTTTDVEHGPGERWRVTVPLPSGRSLTVRGDDSSTASVTFP